MNEVKEVQNKVMLHRVMADFMYDPGGGTLTAGKRNSSSDKI